MKVTLHETLRDLILHKAYTMELEAEVAKLKEENEQLQKKQAEIMEVQKNQALEMVKQQSGAKRQCLRRTQTGPW
ncbi:ABSCISIC ACID-INSENSITIVE 5-like protein 6 [Salvia hispanica]|uniref:ABSCISIC ACID-INSENSITIVE 5-like protein 6 n=1 Tax=Salvia hispanica TaxID=49212 RepID=UPI0020091B0E|nr:ABSCISIC ACID-INSENSITIVE 5-like protein 6 isoform X2 [Salvia hispanica]XP_047979613.1 ABSCISIC ACID-INSENSITIVE 5-like protein 6 [Salvia hispanica]XP_047979621.1 ABSCISIC ACID-INSENSITIVE 5-like protein 6 [Salvia hispanica]XP_047979630.1 ABSCISIC ACID-INSENSITIVE 5-like protein 6 [Salvia hispanica]